MVLSNGRHHVALRVTLMEIVNRFIDSAAHVAETIRGAHNRIAGQIEQIPPHDLDICNLPKFKCEGFSYFAIHVTKAQAKMIGWGGTERFERFHAAPANAV